MPRSCLVLLLALAACAAPVSAPPPAQGGGRVEILWLGQSCFRITTPQGRVIVTDPWLAKNPMTPAAYKDPAALGKVDLLLVTHGHGDHIADAPEVARRNGIPLYAPGDLNMTLTLLGVLPGAQLPRANKSGSFSPLPGITVTQVHAEHSSIFVWSNPATGKDEAHAAGEAVGFIIELENGFRIWHMGDTGVFGDMKWIADYYHPDLVLVPIGGFTTMGPADAAWALRELVRPRAAIPMHYGANPAAKGTPGEFVEALRGAPVTVQVLKPGETATF